MRPWLLPAVYERLRTGRGEFLAELRPAIPVFVRFGGIDYDDDDDAIEKLDDFVRRAQRDLRRLRRQPPPADARRQGRVPVRGVRLPARPRGRRARAAAAALELRELDRITAAREIQIGITHGRLRSGTYGHAMRRTFVCLGDAVNLAARLMSKAPPGPCLRRRGGARAGRRRVHLGATARRDGQGQGGAGPVFALDRAARGRRRRAAAVRAADGRPRGRARGARGGSRPGARRAAARSSASPPRRAWASRGWSPSSCDGARRRGTVVAFGECQAFGANTSYWRLARDLAAPPASRRRRPRGRAGARRSSARLAAHRPGPRRARAAARRRARRSDPRQRADRALRRQAAQDVARGAARRLPARAGGRRAARARAGGLPLDRRALARPARGRSPAQRRRLPVLVVLAYRPAAEPGGGLGLERPAALHGARRSTALEPTRTARARSARSSSSCSERDARPRRRSSSSSPRGRRATRSTSRSCSTTSAARASSRATRAACARSSCPTACTA